MPLYEYKCDRCGHTFEKIENHKASTTKKCPSCGGKARRQLASPAIQFKGSGWYVTDYSGKKASVGTGEKAGDGASAKPAEKPAESKPSAEKDTAKKKK